MADNIKEMVKHVKEGKDHIKVKADLGKKIIRIKSANQIAFMGALGAMSVAIAALVAIPVAGPVALGMKPIALGAAKIAFGPAALTAVSIVVAARSVTILRTIRHYDIKKEGDHYHMTKRK